MKMADDVALQDANAATGPVGAAIACARAAMLAATDKAIAQAERGKPAVAANIDGLVERWNRSLAGAGDQAAATLSATRAGATAVAAAATMRGDGAASDFFFPVANGGSLERRPPRMKFEV